MTDGHQPGPTASDGRPGEAVAGHPAGSDGRAGYLVDPDALAASAARLGEAADEARTAATALEEPVGDLGPEGVTEAVEHLAAEWARVLRGLELPVLSDGLRAAAETYRQADELRHD